MSELSSDTATGGQDSMPSSAAGGTPEESDLPQIQGLGDDPDTAGAGLDESAAGSDPMPDMSGTGGTEPD